MPPSSIPATPPHRHRRTDATLLTPAVDPCSGCQEVLQERWERRPCTLTPSPDSTQVGGGILGSQRSISTARVANIAGTHDAVEDAGDVSQRRRHQRRVARELAGATSARAPIPRRPGSGWCGARPLGSAVVPEVYINNRRSSGSICELRVAVPRGAGAGWLHVVVSVGTDGVDPVQRRRRARRTRPTSSR